MAGDGGKAVGVCAQKQPPVAAFPAHWAPNDLLIYPGGQFPVAYKDGAFIAFHGSWNRAPWPQGGYNVVFQPLADGKASGPFVVSPTDLQEPYKEPGRATHRPTGLAVGPMARCILLTITAGGSGASPTRAATRHRALRPRRPRPPARQAAASAGAAPPEGVHPDAGLAALPIPAARSPDQVALGNRIFHGQADGATCRVATVATARAPRWGLILPAVNTCGATAAWRPSPTPSTAACRKQKSTKALCRRWAVHELSPADVTALAQYVWALGHSTTQ